MTDKTSPFAWYWFDATGCLFITGDDRKPDVPADAKPLYEHPPHDHPSVCDELSRRIEENKLLPGERLIPTLAPVPNVRLSDLIEQSKACLAAMSEEERQAMWQAQRESFARGMSTPCEHGVLDFEQCQECRKPAPQDQTLGADFRSLLQNMIDNDGGTGSKGYDARLYLDARNAALAALSSAPEVSE